MIHTATATNQRRILYSMCCKHVQSTVHYTRPLQEVGQIREVVWPLGLCSWATKDAYLVLWKYITRVLSLRQEEELRGKLQAT